MAEFLCAIRCEPIRSIQYLTSQQQHGRGIGKMAEDRVTNPKLPRAYSWTSLTAKPATIQVQDKSDHSALVKALKKRIADAGATPRKNASIGLHLLATVSDAWLEEGKNVANQKGRLFHEARQWADLTFGKGSLFGARIDLNEKGRSTVDLFVCPVRTQKIGRGRKEKLMVAPSAALAGVAVSQGRHPAQSYAALQDSWAEHCAKRLDSRIKRGKSKIETGLVNLSPEDYGKEKDKRRDKAVRRLLGAFRAAAPRLFKWAAGKDWDVIEPLARSAPKKVPALEKKAGYFRRLASWVCRADRFPEFEDDADADLVDAAHNEAKLAEDAARAAEVKKTRMIQLAQAGLRQRDPEERQAEVCAARAWCKQRGIDYSRKRGQVRR